MSKWEKITPTIRHQKKKKNNNRGTEELENGTDVGRHAQKHHDTRTTLRLNFESICLLAHVSAAILWFLQYSSNLSAIVTISHKHSMNDRTTNEPSLLLKQPCTSQVTNKTRVYIHLQSSSSTLLFSAFQLRHTSQWCQCEHHVISMINPRLHRTRLSPHLRFVHIFLLPPC